MKNKMNTRGIAPLFIILFVILALIIIYLFLFIPIPAFTNVRMIINYFIIIIIWIIIQVGLIWGYYEIGNFAIKGFKTLKTKIIKGSLDIRKFIILHT